MRKILSFICAIALLMQCIMVYPVQAQAAEVVESGTCGENLIWTLDNEGTLTISGTGPMTDYTDSRSPWFDSEDIKCVIIEDGVTTIGWSAFCYCDALISVMIPDSVTDIGENAFTCCSSLTSITIPDGVTTIRYGAFSECHSLTGFLVGENNPEFTNDERGVLFNKDKTELLKAPEKISGSYGIPESVTSIAGAAFMCCSNLTGITIPDSVTFVEYDTFRSCSSLTDVTIPDSVTGIDFAAFLGCKSLTSISIPDSVTYLNEYAFDECSSLTGIWVGENNPRYASDEKGALFNKDKTELLIVPEGISGSYTVPAGVTYISDYLFDGCSSLTSITIPDGVTDIGECAFNGCSSLTSIAIPESVTSIGDYAFDGCSSLSSIMIPVGITSIGSFTFSECSSLTSITIPDSVTDIGICALRGCSSLTSITIPEAITSIGDSAFGGCSSLTSIMIPDKITSIAPSTFWGCSSLTSITIPDSVTEIGDGAFAYCSSLTGIMIPDSVTEIGDYAFEGCSSLTSITIPDGVTDIGDYEFYGCTSLTSIAIPESVTSIGDSAFDGCSSLTSIIIPDSITNVGECAFSNCDKLVLVHYTGTEEQRDFVGLGYQFFESVEWHYNVTKKWEDGQKVYYCPICDIHYLPDGTEVSQKNQVTLIGKNFSLSFEDEILVNFYYEVSDTTDVVEQGMLVFYADPGAADIAKADDVYTGAASDGAVFMNTTDGIAAKYMGDSRYYCAYAKLTDGSYAYSKLYQYSPKKYAMNMLGKDSTSEKQKALCVAMLNYGAAAQNFFGYKTDALMNSELTDEQKALVVAYDETLFTGAVPADSGKIANFTKTATGFSARSASVSFEGAFSINYYFTPSVAVNGEVTLYYWTPEDYAAADVLTVDNASGSSTMVVADGNYWGQVSGIAAKKLDDTYYVAGVYTDAEGNTYCTGVIAYSLSKYCMNNAKPGKTMQELASATAMYGYYAKNYFA